MSLLSVEHLQISFRQPDGRLAPVVRDVSFAIEAGAGLAVVGESGSGKSVTARSLAGLLDEPPAVVSGRILFRGEDVRSLRGEALRQLRGRRIGYIFQEPGAALNPVFSIRSHLAEVFRTHRPDVGDMESACVRSLEDVGIHDARRRLSDYPHQFSGGMQQRIVIALALAARPDLLIADEPTASLDVSTQRQIISLLARIRRESGTALLLITHHFGIIRELTENVAVMFRGRIVESGTVDDVLRRPQHPYTRALIGCIPRPGSGLKRLPVIDPALVEESETASVPGSGRP